ncbi:MBL fold metallo-hydrolase [Cytobacillus purgationiresistens]|uniref:Ribonuclease BN (tRNA processing enzyme) n=1 Tax=Cytobacillus purgationiresistens TaxID=863449 RepID=A0ABU0ADG1_9BACI|nr:MBL fold metallo-hydrolase [Cytobacillus purgationiresistens]MDQ0268837.1 ribonuclease BN (tRNA processing enzyme) [Cytobacillus purgationiresistens]
MNFTVIGSCGGYPKANEASAGYLLEHKGFYLLIDCGSAVLSKMQSFFQPEDLDAVIISHYHPDHIADIGVLQHARLIQGFLGMKRDCLPVYGHALDEQEFAKLTYKEITKGIPYESEMPINIGPFTITFLRTDHPVPCFAMRIEADGHAIVYTADTSFKEELVTFSKEANLLVSECNFYSHQEGKGAGHMNSHDNGKLANSANVKHLLLTHLPHYGTIDKLKDEASAYYKGPISLAEFGLSFHI